MGTCSLADRCNGLEWVSGHDFRFRQIIGKGGFGKVLATCLPDRCGRFNARRMASYTP